MKEDIKVIKTVGSISGNESTWQKELNIVSINNGPLKYDLREWSLDHSSFRNGISFDNEEAKVLLAIMKDCFKDGGKSITIDSYPDAIQNPDSEGQVAFVIKPFEEDNKKDEALFSFLKENKIEYTDKRSLGGALWIVGGHEYDDIIVKCADLGYRFFYSEKGGRITNNQPAWYLRAKKKI